ncbi:hypothetical protein [Desulfoscipio sp. XC116]|uniref:hypothetical protein n=1 Tax=Desulfoscipio sp. XC116 TaxID=3144975 RepID=UPI00325ACDC7
MALTVHEDVVCTFCGCLCDDLKVEVADNQIAKVSNACAIGRNKLMHAQTDLASFRVNGREATWEEVISEATNILNRAKAPLVYGLSSTTTEAVREAVALTEKIKGTIDNPASY